MLFKGKRRNFENSYKLEITITQLSRDLLLYECLHLLSMLDEQHCKQKTKQYKIFIYLIVSQKLGNINLPLN